MKEKTTNIRRIVIRILIVLLILFGIWNGLWLYYRQHYFIRVAENAGMTKQQDMMNTHYLSEVSLENGNTAHYGVFLPHYLRFSHNYEAFEEPNPPFIEQDGKYIYPCDYRITLGVHPSLFGKPRYQIVIYDLKTANEEYLAGKTAELDYGKQFTFDVDAHMNIIQEWSYGGQAVWDDAHDEAYAMFTRAKDVFGL